MKNIERNPTGFSIDDAPILGLLVRTWKLLKLIIWIYKEESAEYAVIAERSLIVLLEGETPWDVDLAPCYASDLLLYLTSQDAAQIRKYVLPNLLIEDAAQFDQEVLGKV